jgi:AraC-like DNA-binding protein
MKNIEKNVEIIKMMQQWLNEPKKNFMLNMGYSNLLFFKIVESYELQDREGEKNKAGILKLLQYINEHYLEDISLTSVAQKIGYSKEHCSKIFSESVGMGFRDYLSFLRLKKAQEYFSLKKDLKLTTIEIIYKCGFKSTATFYRAQKRFKDKNIKN